MARSNYIVKKLRLGRDGSWSPWEYEAVSESPDYQASDNAERGTTARRPSIDALARELATFPNIGWADLYADPDPSGVGAVVPHVSLALTRTTGVTMTQEGVVTDDELGELATRIVGYLKEKK